MEIDKSKPVLVTGATGYVAGWLVKKLLEAGITVHAAVRNPDNKAKVKHLDDMAQKASGEIKYFKADLLEDGAYDAAMEGCELVYHTASPFVLGVKDAQRDLVDPALKGTRNVLNSANKVASVKRVVVTSSCASIYGDSVDLQKTKNGVFTEDDWNTTSNLKHQAYSYSKVLAEREAWKMAEAQSRWDLVVINPSFVIGPGTASNATSGSFDIVKQMGDGTLKLGAPEFNIGVVDVRDLADAHFKAGYTPEAKGRHIISAEDSSFLKLAQALQPNFGQDYPLPKKHLPKFLVWLMAPSAGLTRREAKLNVGHPWKADNSKSVRELKMKYRPSSESINEMFQQFVEAGHFKK